MTDGKLLDPILHIPALRQFVTFEIIKTTSFTIKKYHSSLYFKTVAFTLYLKYGDCIDDFVFTHVMCCSNIFSCKLVFIY